MTKACTCIGRMRERCPRCGEQRLPKDPGCRTIGCHAVFDDDLSHRVDCPRSMKGKKRRRARAARQGGTA